jgi:hypothetical protein
VDANGDMRDALVGADLTWYGRSHEVRAGIQLDAYRFDYDVQRRPGGFFADFFPEFRRTSRLTTLEGYIEDQWSPTAALTLRAGVRALQAGECRDRDTAASGGTVGPFSDACPQHRRRTSGSGRPLVA